MDDDFIFSVYFGFVIFFAEGDSAVEFFDHVGGFAIECIDIGVLNGHSRLITLADAVDNCIQVVVLFLTFLFLQGLF